VVRALDDPIVLPQTVSEAEGKDDPQQLQYGDCCCHSAHCYEIHLQKFRRSLSASSGVDSAVDDLRAQEYSDSAVGSVLHAARVWHGMTLVEHEAHVPRHIAGAAATLEGSLRVVPRLGRQEGGVVGHVLGDVKVHRVRECVLNFVSHDESSDDSSDLCEQ